MSEMAKTEQQVADEVASLMTTNGQPDSDMSEEAKSAVIKRKQPESEETGRVALVGAGPGDPDLLTVKAARLIAQSDVIVYDRLVSEAIRATFPASARLVYVGKAKGQVSWTQSAINALLVALAQQGLSVCRLKGGDAFIFGRGSEEWQALSAQGIAVDIVPGITAAAGCTSYAGIPLTHRGIAQGCTFVTAHAEKQLRHDWSALAQLDHTLVFYMGLTQTDTIATQLQAAGMPASTPVAVIEKGCCPEQRVFRGVLSGLPALVNQHQVRSPALIVVGEVTALSLQHESHLHALHHVPQAAALSA